MIKWLLFILTNLTLFTYAQSSSPTKYFHARTLKGTTFLNIDSALIHKDSIVYVHIKGHQTLPKQLNQFPDIKTLKIAYCPTLNLEQAITYIAKMKSVNELIFENNNTKVYPDNLGRLKHLTCLWIFEEPIYTLPSSVRKLKRLNDLLINECENLDLDTTFDILSSNRSIQSLDLSDNLFPNIPTSIRQFKNVKALWLDGNRLKEIPKEVKQLPKLEKLIIWDNLITEIHLDSTDFPALEHIELVWNYIQDFPTDFQHIKTLKHLDLGANESLIVPDNLKFFQFLDTLDLQMCNISYLKRDEITDQLPEVNVIF